jgi:hypothetical protein
MYVLVVTDPRFTPMPVSAVVTGIPVRIDTLAYAHLLRLKSPLTGVGFQWMYVQMWIGAADGSDIGRPETFRYA